MAGFAEASSSLKENKDTKPTVIMDLPYKRMNHDGPRVVEVTYDGSPGLISKLHDRYAPVSRVGPVEVFGNPVVSQVFHSIYSIGCQYLPACADQSSKTTV